MSTSFNRDHWDALTEAQRVQMRRLYTSIQREAFTSLAMFREAAMELKAINDRALERTRQIVGGEENVLKLFGVLNPLGVEQEIDVEVRVDKKRKREEDDDVCCGTVTFGELVESTEEAHEFLEQFDGVAVFKIPHEEF